MSTWTAPHDGTFHIAPGREPHDFAHCARLGCDRTGVFPWLARGAVVDVERMLATADEKPPTRGQSEP